jgi:hypothetical protein
VVYGVLYLLVSALTAVWVRRVDLVTAPIVVPIGFAVGMLPFVDDDGGVAGRLMGLVTGLAVEAGWLYGGTLVAGLIVTVRKVRLMNRRAGRGGGPARGARDGQAGPGGPAGQGDRGAQADGGQRDRAPRPPAQARPPDPPGRVRAAQARRRSRTV